MLVKGPASWWYDGGGSELAKKPFWRTTEPWGGALVTVCTTEAEPWVDASVTDESLTGLREGDSPEVVPMVAVWSGAGCLVPTLA